MNKKLLINQPISTPATALVRGVVTLSFCNMSGISGGVCLEGVT